MLEAKRNFVRFISHEIRTPLNALSMGLELIRKGVLDGSSVPEIIETLDDAKEACGIAVQTLNEILSYEKLEAGKMELDVIAVNAWEFLSSTVRPFWMQVCQMCESINFYCLLFCMIVFTGS